MAHSMMRIFSLYLFLPAWTLCFAAAPALGASDEVMAELRALKARIQQLEKKVEGQDAKLAEQAGKIAEQENKIADQGTRIVQQQEAISSHNGTIEEVKKVKEALGNMEFSIGATSVIQGTINNDRNLRKVPGQEKKGDDADASYSVDIEVSSKLSDTETAYLHLEAGDGEGLNTEAGGLTGVNLDALGDSVDLEVAELWYERSFFSEKLVATVGKLDATVYFDGNAVANDETSQFLSDQFVNNIAVEWPDYSYGGRLSWLPNDWFNLNLGYLEADGDYEDIFDDNFYIAETVFRTNFFKLPGNYRFYGWHNSGEHEKLRNPRRDDKKGGGAGISFDQQASEHITLFCRYGQQRDDVYLIRRAWSLGFQITGSLWSREDDAFGLAYGSAQTSGSYRSVLRNEGFDTAPSEKRLEAYYRYQVNKHLSISPDIQWVGGMYGADSDSVTILGVRAQLNFK